MTYVGIDACSKGWIAVAMADDGIAQAHFLPTIAMVGSVIPDALVIAIDIPIGFPTTGHREADLSARRVLGSRRSSLFLTPSLAVLEAETHAIATALAVELTGQGISRQSYGLRTKIFEVAQWVPGTSWPVRGLRPRRPRRDLILKIPKLRSSTVCPPATVNRLGAVSVPNPTLPFITINPAFGAVVPRPTLPEDVIIK